jgi:hypothetical protein
VANIVKIYEFQAMDSNPVWLDGQLITVDQKEKKVSLHKAPHLPCCRALEVQKYVCAPDALHLRHPVNACN